jgi:uncharacterized membrane protein YhfC
MGQALPLFVSVFVLVGLAMACVGYLRARWDRSTFERRRVLEWATCAHGARIARLEAALLGRRTS